MGKTLREIGHQRRIKRSTIRLIGISLISYSSKTENDISNAEVRDVLNHFIHQHYSGEANVYAGTTSISTLVRSTLWTVVVTCRLRAIHIQNMSLHLECIHSGPEKIGTTAFDFQHL